MKKLIAALFPAICVVALSVPGHADTVNLKFVSVGGANSGGEYIYPYQFSVNGSSSLTTLMCIDLARTIDYGESWTATTVAVPTAPSTSIIPNDGPLTGTDLRAAAWLFDQANSGANMSDAQWAAWAIIDGDAVFSGAWDAGSQSLYNSALAFAGDSSNNSYFNQFVLYTPTPGQNNNNYGGLGKPQDFVGYAPPGWNLNGVPTNPTPEPSSLLLFGSGLAGLAGVVRRSLRK